MSDLLLRAPSASNVAARVRVHAATTAHRVSLDVDSSIDAVTAAAIQSLWRTVGQPGTGARVSVGRSDIANSSVVAAFEARAWADLVLSSFARETNLLIPSTRFLIVGTGHIADALAAAIIRFGGRIQLTADEPVGLLDIAIRHAAPSHRITESPFIPADVDVVVATGVGHPPLTPDAVAAGERPLLVVDAGTHATFHPDSVTAAWTVRGLGHFEGPRPIVVVPRVETDALHHTAAEIRAAYAVLLATVGTQHADVALAEALQP